MNNNFYIQKLIDAGLGNFPINPVQTKGLHWYFIPCTKACINPSNYKDLYHNILILALRY